MTSPEFSDAKCRRDFHARPSRAVGRACRKYPFGEDLQDVQSEDYSEFLICLYDRMIRESVYLYVSKETQHWRGRRLRGEGERRRVIFF